MVLVVLVVSGDDDDDDEVPDRFIRVGNVGVGRELDGDRPWETGMLSTDEPCTAVVIGGPCPLDTRGTGGKEESRSPCSK